MKYYDRATKEILQEDEYGQGVLRFLYNTFIGRGILRIIVKPFFSKLAALYKRSRLSKGSIPKFVKRYNVEVTPEQMASFKSFNDFFTRERRVEFSGGENELCSVADSRVSIYPITKELRLEMKNSVYTVSELTRDEALARRFAGGSCIVFRLALDDMHHYYYADSGRVLSCTEYDGELHTVRSISESHRVFVRNKQTVTVMETAHLGNAVQIEIGALMVGKIINHPVESFDRGDEKGYFELGGSTVVLLTEKPVHPDDDIEAVLKDGLEVRVRAGERIGRIC